MEQGKQITLHELLERTKLDTHDRSEERVSTRKDSVQPDSSSQSVATRRKSPDSQKPRKPPPITPRRFNRFFSPRSSVSHGRQTASRAARQLQDITRNAINRGAASRTSPRRPILFTDIDDRENLVPSPNLGSSRKRKSLPTPTSSPPQSSPCKRARRASPVDIPSSPPEIPSVASRSPSPKPVEGKRIIRIGASRLATAGRILERSFGGSEALSRGIRNDHCMGWQPQTSDFYSRPEDVHPFRHPALPFCSTMCNTNSLVAIGDETGGITVIDSEAQSLATTHVDFRPHNNAIIDLAFSSDDLLLATSSGDQTARVIDMRTQQLTHILRGHYTSVKQVRFQPGDDNVLATSSRDGDINVWDLRCSPSGPVLKDFRTHIDPAAAVDVDIPSSAVYASIYNTISGAHSKPPVPETFTSTLAANEVSHVSKHKEVSVTALAFLPTHPHLLLSGSEASTTVRLWDIRSRRRGSSTPLSITMQPDSHHKHRQFGISSLVFGGNGSRLYALSRDNTLYAYAVSHLILGHAPELSSTSNRPKYTNDCRTGLGPIYGFRHPKFHATSFYVKAAVRPASPNVELVAVGSSNNCAVVFPTDETMFRWTQSHSASDFNTSNQARDREFSSSIPTRRPALRRTTSGIGLRMMDTIPIYDVGSALISGHRKEVTSLTWTYNGDSLVTLSDDYMARRWKEDEWMARDLRTGGEAEGRRWGSGWAEIEDQDYDLSE